MKEPIKALTTVVSFAVLGLIFLLMHFCIKKELEKEDKSHLLNYFKLNTKTKTNQVENTEALYVLDKEKTLEINDIPLPDNLSIFFNHLAVDIILDHGDQYSIDGTLVYHDVEENYELNIKNCISNVDKIKIIPETGIVLSFKKRKNHIVIESGGLFYYMKKT